MNEEDIKNKIQKILQGCYYQEEQWDGENEWLERKFNERWATEELTELFIKELQNKIEV